MTDARELCDRVARDMTTQNDTSSCKLPSLCRLYYCVESGFSKFPKITLQYEGDDDVDAMFISTTSSADNDMTSTDVVAQVGSRRDVDAMLFFLEIRKSGRLCESHEAY